MDFDASVARATRTGVLLGLEDFLVSLTASVPNNNWHSALFDDAGSTLFYFRQLGMQLSAQNYNGLRMDDKVGLIGIVERLHADISAVHGFSQIAATANASVYTAERLHPFTATYRCEHGVQIAKLNQRIAEGYLNEIQGMRVQGLMR